MKIFHKLFGTRNQKLLNQYQVIVNKANILEKQFAAMSDADLAQQTQEMQLQLSHGQSLDSIMHIAFAVFREATVRVLNMRPFDVQLLGAIALHEGKIAEMKTGEGKTLVGGLAGYLNALSGKGVHVVTVNDYLVKRDASHIEQVFKFLGLTVGHNLSGMTIAEKKAAFACDITFGTNNEFGFDYLRDNMVYCKDDKVIRELNFAIIDEVDSILIDEARTPLIISGAASDSSQLYMQLNSIPPKLTPQFKEDDQHGDFWVDEKNHNIVLSEAGHEKIENILKEYNLISVNDSLYNISNMNLVYHVIAALKAHYLYFINQHYVIESDKVVIIDEFTGRLMPGRRWSEGLHQAVEAKENLPIESENHTLASITFQNYFRLYNKLSGMTGTADTEAYEFKQIYGLEVVIIPTNKNMIRIDHDDKIFINIDDKYKAIIDEVATYHAKGQPILIGTTSVEKSEIVSKLLTNMQLKHQVLNAKHHAKEAEIIAQAGAMGAITVATNMAGRGTDIILGGNPDHLISKIQNSSFNQTDKDKKITAIRAEYQEKRRQVVALGGLYIIGTERHESRRIDNQLRGRSGRQGDPGMSRFFLSLDDPLLRLFGGEKMRFMMQKLGIKPGESLEHKWLSRAIESAGRKVEGYNFDIRRQLLDYDNVINEQRHVIYHKREEILNQSDMPTLTLNMMHDIIQNEAIQQELIHMLPKNVSTDIMAYYIEKINRIKQGITTNSDAWYHQFLQHVFLQQIDYHWQNHITLLEDIKHGIHLRGYAQKDPKQEYRHESFQQFSLMLDNLKINIVKILLIFELEPAPATVMKSSRNALCECGSNKKFKHCCGAAHG